MLPSGGDRMTEKGLVQVGSSINILAVEWQHLFVA